MHIKNMEDQRRTMMQVIQNAKPDERAILKDMEVVPAMVRPEPRNDLGAGGSGCWGDNITDVRLEARRYKKNPANGDEIAGSDTR